MLILYRFLINIVCFLSPIIFKIRIYKNKEDKKRYKEKLCIIRKKRPKGKLVWFHASSVGELLSVIPLIEKIEKRKNIKTILFTSNTLSSSKVLMQKKKFKKIIHQFLPIDTEEFANSFLNHWKPNAAFFIESEIWPNFIFNIKQKKIPLILINGRITNKTYNSWKKIYNFSKKIFENFDLCLVQNEETKKYLKYFKVKKILNLGNIKFAKSKYFLPSKTNKKIKDLSKNRNIWCASSTHYNEEELCAKIHTELKKKIKNLITIIIPRHIHRTEEIFEKLKTMNLKIYKHNDYGKIQKNTDIYLVNTYGETPDFYNISNFVFLGGSFINHGGQNPIEPARLGCKIYHGPNVHNFAEVYKYLNSAKISNKVKNIKDLKKNLINEFTLNYKKNYKFRKQIDLIGQKILNDIFFRIKVYL